jgi:hypothetical protein
MLNKKFLGKLGSNLSFKFSEIHIDARVYLEAGV